MYNMANLGRPLSRLCCLSSKSGSLSFNRHLFSSDILGVENFKRIRIFEKDRLPNKADFVEQLSATCHGSQLQGRRVAADLIKLIYIADERRDVQLVTDLLKQLYTNETNVLMCDKDRSTPSSKFTTEGPLSPRQFQFGPLLFRLLYVLKDLATAQSFYSDKDLNWLFRSTTCHLLLMDMLYEDGRYQQVVDVFAALQRSGVSARFTPDCTTLAFAALYQLNSEESCRGMRQMLEEAEAEGSILSRRCLLFAATLALRQRESSLALTIAESLSSSNGTLFQNIKLMALAQLGHLEEILATLERKGPRGSPTIFHNGHLYSDTVQRLKEQISTSGSSELKAKFSLKMDYLESEGLLSPQTVEHFVIRPILRQKKAKTSQSFKTRLKSPIKMKYNS